MKPSCIQVGIVGIGGYGRHLLEGLLDERQSTKLEIVSAVVVDPDRDREHLAFLKAHCPSARIYRTCDALFKSAPSLDLLVLPVGIPAHKHLTLSGLKMGWNVLLEKPLAGSVAEARAICEAVERSPHFVALGYQDMYGSAVLEMKQAMLAGKIGRIRRISALAIWGRAKSYYDRNAWAGRLTLDGAPVFDSPFHNGLAHFLNMALVLAGDEQGNPATPLRADAALFRAHDIESCDTSTIRWQTDSGTQVDIYFSHLTSKTVGPEVLIEGSEGSILWKGEEFWELRSGDGKAVRLPLQTTPELRKAMLRRVLEKAGGAKAAVFTPRQSLAQVQAVELAHAATEIQTLSGEELAGEADEWIEIPHLEEMLRAARTDNRLLVGDSSKELR